MMHRGGARIYEQVKGMTVEEEVKFWKDKTLALRQEQRAARAQQKSA